jgi:hypothetical protein
MSARISREFGLQAAIYYEENFIINTYEIQLYMDVNTDSIREQNISMDRIKYLFDVCLDSCVFVGAKNSKVIDLYEKAGLVVCPLPDEPFDQVIGALLIRKINTIAENTLFVTEIKIKSSICDDVIFYVSYDEETEFQNLQGVWWNENSPNISMNNKKSKKEKVVDLKKESIDWNILGLGWKEETKKGEVVFIPVEK